MGLSRASGREAAYLTVFARVAQGAGAAVGTQAVNTRSLIQARVRVALVDIMEAEGTSETHRAQAREGVDAINTRAPVETGAEEPTGEDISHVTGSSDLLLGRMAAEIWSVRGQTPPRLRYLCPN